MKPGILQRWKELRRALAVLRPWRGRLILVGLLGLPLAGAGLGLVWGLGYALDALGGAEGFSLLRAVLILAAVLVLRAVLGSLHSLLGSLLTSRIELELTKRSFDHLLGLPLLTARSGGYAATSLFHDCRHFVDTAAGLYRTLLLEGSKALAFWGYLLVLDWRVGLLLGLITPLAALPFLAVTRRLGREAERFYRSTDDYWGRAVEAAGAPRLIRGYGGQRSEGRHFAEAGERRRRRMIRQQILQITLGPLGEFFVALAVGAAIWIGFDAAELTTLSLGRLGSAAVALGWLLYSLKGLYGSLGPLENLSVVHRRLESLWTSPVEKLDGPAPPTDWSGLALRSCSFAYPGGEKVFDGLELELEAGRAYQLLGPSGVGKTTLGRLLCRLYDPDSGALLVDDTQLDAFGRGAWRAQALLVDQEPEFLPGNLLEAVCYPEEVDSVDLDEARRLLVLTGLDDLPVERRLSLDGSELSGGQRRRLALVRALLRRPRLLVLDEVTSFIEPAAEERLLKNVRNELPEALLLIISHRPGIGALVDRRISLRPGAPPLLDP